MGTAADGKFGPKTLQAVATALKCSVSIKSVQSAVGTKVDGLLGPNTYNAIVVALGIQKAPAAKPATTTTATDPLVEKYINKPVSITKVDYKVKNLPRQKEVRAGTSVFGKSGNEGVLVNVPVPAGYPLKYEGKKVKTIRIHELVADRLEAALNDIVAHYGEDIEKVAPGVCVYGGSYNNRSTVSGGSKSLHAWGIALDFDAEKNAYSTKKPKARLSQPVYAPFLKILEAHGFLSLGLRNDVDWMHVQCCKWDS